MMALLTAMSSLLAGFWTDGMEYFQSQVYRPYKCIVLIGEASNLIFNYFMRCGNVFI